MATLAETLHQRLIDIQAQIAFIQADSAAKVAALQAQADVLTQSASLITPEIEQAVTALKSIGVLTQL